MCGELPEIERKMRAMAVDQEKLLDDVGWRILGVLQNNGRLSFAELGRRVNLSLPVVVEPASPTLPL